MADKGISSIGAASTPLDGTELVKIIQGGNSRRVTSNNLVKRAQQALIIPTLIQIFNYTADVAIGDLAGGVIFRIPDLLNGYDLTSAKAYHGVAGSGGSNTTIQIHNISTAVDMLSSPITINAGSLNSSSVTINLSNDNVATDNRIRFDVDTLPNTVPKGLWMELQFTKP